MTVERDLLFCLIWGLMDESLIRSMLFSLTPPDLPRPLWPLRFTPPTGQCYFLDAGCEKGQE